MKEPGLVCRVRMRKYRSCRGEVGKNRTEPSNGDFYAEKPNQKWATDVTKSHLFGQKLHLFPVLDLCSPDLFSCTISERHVLSMVTSMLNNTFETIPDGTELILYADQGGQYQQEIC